MLSRAGRLEPEWWLRVAPILLITLLVVTGFVGLPLVGGTAGAPAHGAAVDIGTDMTIDSTLEAESGTVEIIVRLAGIDIATAATPDEATTRLQRHAERTQAALVADAEQTEGVTVRNQFWLTNAVLLEVDTNQVDLERFGQFEAVTRLEANEEVSLPNSAVIEPGTDVESATESDGVTASGFSQHSGSLHWR